jgi:hypothetical protein
MVKGTIDTIEYRILWYKAGNLNSVPEEITACIDHSSQDGVKLENNVVNLNLKLNYIYNLSLFGQTTKVHQFVNPTTGKIAFSSKDILRIFCKYRDGVPIDITKYDDILQDYIVKTWTLNEQGKILSLSAVDINYKIFNRLSNGVYTTNVNGTLTSKSSNTMTDTTASWTTNQWVNRTLQFEDSSGKEYCYLILSNTATTITVHQNIYSGVTNLYKIGHSSASAIVNALKLVVPVSSYTGSFDLIVNTTTNIGTAYKADVQLLRPDNSAFPIIDFAIAREPYHKLLSELSSVNAVNTSWELENNTKTILRDMQFSVSYDIEQKKYRLNWYVLTAPNKLDSGLVTGFTSNTITDSSQSMTTNEYANKLIRVNGKTYQILSNNATTFTLGNYVSSSDIAISNSYSVVGDCEFIWDNEKDFKQIYDATMGTETEDAFNHIYFTCGTNPMKNRDIIGHKLNETSDSLELKETFIPMKGIVREFLKIDNRFDTVNSKYDYPSSYPYTTAWGAIVESDSDYDDALKDVCRRKAYLKCEDIFAKVKEGYLKGTFVIRGNRFIQSGESDTTSKWYSTGSRILYKNLAQGVVNPNQPQGYYFLRVKTIKHQIKDGTWSTNLEVEYDVYSELEESNQLDL